MAKLKHFGILNIKHFVVFVTIVQLHSCRQSPVQLQTVTGAELFVDSTAAAVQEIGDFITPYRERVYSVLDSTLAYAPYPITKTDGTFNTTAGNLMADIMLSEANPIFKERSGKEIGFVLMNHGGIRASISKGPVSASTAYEVMPFENSITVVALSGESVLELIDYLVQSGRAHPLAGIQIVLNPDKSINSLTVQGKAFDPKGMYYVATSDYLVSGGDDMVFFKNGRSFTPLDYKIRNAMIDYFSKVDTLLPKVDDRYYQLD